MPTNKYSVEIIIFCHKGWSRTDAVGGPRSWRCITDRIHHLSWTTEAVAEAIAVYELWLGLCGVSKSYRPVLRGSADVAADRYARVVTARSAGLVRAGHRRGPRHPRVGTGHPAARAARPSLSASRAASGPVASGRPTTTSVQSSPKADIGDRGRNWSRALNIRYQLLFQPGAVPSTVGGQARAEGSVS